MAVTPDDIAVELGRTAPTAAESVQWQTWIDRARFLIRYGDGVHAGLGDLALLDQEALDYVVLLAVTAHVRRPDDSTQVDVAIDDGRVSKRYTSGSGAIEILDAWWGMLSPEGSSAVEAFTISPFGAADPSGSDSVPRWWAG